LFSTAAFGNQMVFHSIDNITSLVNHFNLPIVVFNLRWNTLEYEAKLPQNERRFVDLDTTFDFYKMFVAPMTIWLIWAILYYFIIIKLLKNYLD